MADVYEDRLARANEIDNAARAKIAVDRENEAIRLELSEFQGYRRAVEDMFRILLEGLGNG